MPVVNETVANGLAAYYEYVAVQLHQWVDPLSNEQFWRKPYAYGNSAGHLVLHVTGNLNYYIGARVAETGYRRDRRSEEHTSELQSQSNLVCRLLLEKKKKTI